MTMTQGFEPPTSTTRSNPSTHRAPLQPLPSALSPQTKSWVTAVPVLLGPRAPGVPQPGLHCLGLCLVGLWDDKDPRGARQVSKKQGTRPATSAAWPTPPHVPPRIQIPLLPT